MKTIHFAFLFFILPSLQHASDSPSIIFFHIPKTGGSNFLNAAKTALRSRPFQWIPNHTYSWVAPLNCKKGLKAHCGFSDIYDCLTKPPYSNQTLYLITLLRNPVDRTLSEYYYWKGGRNCRVAWNYELCNLSNSENLSAWIQSPYNNVWNRQTKALVYIPSMKTSPTQQCVSFSAVEQESFWQNYYNATYEDGLEKLINADLDLAWNAVSILKKHFWFVGITEQMNASIYQLANLSEIATPNFTIGRKVHSKRPASDSKLPKSFIQQIRDRNRLDILLYEYLLRFKKSN